jgi:hypothetical protein
LRKFGHIAVFEIGFINVSMGIDGNVGFSIPELYVYFGELAPGLYSVISTLPALEI